MAAPLDQDAHAFHGPLLAWYAEHARDLPWRRTQDPYAIWISEVMLQQTRVEVVEERWVRFLERFPNVRTLADAPIEEVLAEWAGLGYYRRARTLHAAAQVVVQEHDGEFPKEHQALLALPGIGAYTAGAIASIALGLPEALVDGNVERVLARWLVLEETAGSPALQRASWAAARALLHADLPGTWNQALMELGATCCKPRNPDCSACPVRAACGSAASEDPARLPLPKPRRAVIEVAVELLAVGSGPRLLFVQRPPGGRMAGLWELPTREQSWSGAQAPGLHPLEWPTGLVPRGGAQPGSVRTSITHHRLVGQLRLGALEDRDLVDPSAGAWLTLDEAQARGLTALSAKALSKWRAPIGRLLDEG